jgi:hypothetical protein
MTLAVLMDPPGSGNLWGTRVFQEGAQSGYNAGVWTAYAKNESGTFVVISELGLTDTQAHGLGLRHGEAQNLQWARTKDGTEVAAGNYAAAPSDTGPDTTLHIGSSGNGGGRANLRMASAVFFDRSLSDDEQTRLRAALISKYGVAP